MFVRAKRGRAITRVFFRYLHLTVMFSGLLQKDMLKERLSLVESFFWSIIIVTLVTQCLPSYFLSRPIA